MFQLNYQIMENSTMREFLAKLIILIDTLQMMGFSIHPNLPFIWNNQIIKYLRSTIKYFQVVLKLNTKIDSVLRNADVTISSILLSIVLSITLLMNLFLFYLWILVKIRRKNKRFKKIRTLFVKPLGLYILIQPSIAASSFFQVFYSAVTCFNDSPYSRGIKCFSSQYWIRFSFGAIGMIMFLIPNFIFTYLQVELNPFCKKAIAAPQPNLKIYRFLIKLLLPIYLVTDYRSEYSAAFEIGMTLIYFILLYLRFETPSFYNQEIDKYMVSCDLLLFWVALCCTFQVFFDHGKVDNVGLIYAILGYPILRYVLLRLIERSKTNKTEFDIRSFRNAEEAFIYLCEMIDLIDNYDVIEKQMVLEMILMKHKSGCKEKPGACPCQDIHHIIRSNYFIIEDSDEYDLEYTRKWYCLLTTFTHSCLMRFKRSSKLMLFSGYIYKEKLQKKFAAIEIVYEGERSKGSLLEHFSLYRLKLHLEKTMFEDELRQAEHDGIDIIKMTDFQNHYLKFKDNIYNVLDHSVDFWKEMISKEPDFKSITMLAAKITYHLEKIHKEFGSMKRLFPSHSYSQLLYGYFKKKILFDAISGDQHIQQALYFDKALQANQINDNRSSKYGVNSHSLMIRLSCMDSTFSTITEVNSSVRSMLHYKEKDLNGKNLNIVMPKIFWHFHDEMVRRYLTNSTNTAQIAERYIYPLSSSGYIIPCTGIIKILPDLISGLEMVLFLKELSLPTYVDYSNHIGLPSFIMVGDDGRLLALSQEAKGMLLIDEHMAYGRGEQALNILEVCAKLLEPKKLDEMRTDKGCLVNYDPAYLINNQRLFHRYEESEGNVVSQSNSESIPNDLLQRRGFRIRVFLVGEKTYPSNGIHLLMNKFESSEIGTLINIDQLERKEAGEYDTVFEDEQVNLLEKRLQDPEITHREREKILMKFEQIEKERKILKEFKQTMNINTTPRLVRHLVLITILLIILMLGIAIGDASYKTYKDKSLRSAMRNLNICHNISNEIIITTRSARKLQQITMSEYKKDSSYFSSLDLELRNRLHSESTSLKKNYDELLKVNLDIEDNEPKYRLYDANLSFVELSGRGKTFSRSLFYPNQLEVFIATIFMLTKIKSAELHGLSNYTTAAQRDFFLVWENGKNNLLEYSMLINSKINSSSIDRVYQSHNIYPIICLIGSVFACVALTIIVYSIASISEANLKVMNMVRKITPEKIQALIWVYQHFKNFDMEFIENGCVNIRQSKKEASIEESISAKKGHEEMKRLSHINSQMIQRQISQLQESEEYSSEEEVEAGGGIQPSILNTSRPLVTKEEKVDLSQESNDSYSLIGITTQTEIRKTSRAGTLTFYFFLVGLFFCCYFGWMYTYQNWYLNKIESNLVDFGSIWQAKIQSEATVFFTYESLLEGIESPNVSESRTEMYNNILRLKEIIKRDLPQEFKGFQSLIKTASYNLCLPELKIDLSLCQQNEYLKKGIGTTTVRIAETTRDMIDLMKYNSTTNEIRYDLVNSGEMNSTEFLLDELSKCYDVILIEFLSNYENFIQGYIWNARLLDLTLCISLAILGVIVLRYYSLHLTQLIWRTKTMLNMIPLIFIENNKELRYQITKGRVFNSIK